MAKSKFIRLNNGQLLECADVAQATRFVAMGSGTFIDIPSRQQSPKKRKFIIDSQQGKCAICGANLSETGCDIDHIFPHSQALFYKNGAKKINEIYNLRALCPKCNRSKSDKISSF